MLLIIFGAGASYDSSADYLPSVEDMHQSPEGTFFLRRFRPPLANQLFELRDSFATAAQEIPRCQLVLSKLRNRPVNVSVEQQLGELREQALNYPEAQRQLVGVQFYLQWIIGECQSEWNQRIKSHTTYRALLSQIDRQLKGEPVCLVTFNYDTLLEEAFLSLGRPFGTLDGYISRTDYKIIKPHGSVNWAQELEGQNQTQVERFQLQLANDLMAKAETLRTIDKYHLITNIDRGEGSRWVVSQIPLASSFGAVLPAIAIPLEKKQDYVCPASHLEALRDCVSKADKLLVIGWKGAEENFSRLLSEGLKKGIPKMIVSSGRVSAEKVMLALFGIDGAVDCHLGERGFTNEVRSRSIEAFISK